MQSIAREKAHKYCAQISAEGDIRDGFFLQKNPKHAEPDIKGDWTPGLAIAVVETVSAAAELHEELLPNKVIGFIKKYISNRNGKLRAHLVASGLLERAPPRHVPSEKQVQSWRCCAKAWEAKYGEYMKKGGYPIAWKTSIAYNHYFCGVHDVRRKYPGAECRHLPNAGGTGVIAAMSGPFVDAILICHF